MRLDFCRFGVFCLAAIANGIAIDADETEIASTTLERDNDSRNIEHKTLSALQQVSLLDPPIASSTKSGDVENSEWWLEHEQLLESAWNEWETQHSHALPNLDAILVDEHLRRLMDQARTTPTLEREQQVVALWDEELHANATIYEESSLHRVYRYDRFLTPEGIRKVRAHLEALSKAPIPKRRPNAMNRNGLLLEETVPGGVAGDANLRDFLALLAQEYLAVLGRALFPEFSGNFLDDNHHYAFTIQYGDDSSQNSAFTSNNAHANPINTTGSNTDWELKTHSDASLYTLNINLNHPDEDYSGSALYFLLPPSSNNETKTTTNHYREIVFAPGTAILHRGMTQHGAKPLITGQRNNLVIWVHGRDGFVRTAPYAPSQRLSVRERWSPPGMVAFSKSDFLGAIPTKTLRLDQTPAEKSEL